MDYQVEVIEFLNRRKNKLFRLPINSYSKYRNGEFERIAYSRWAINELIDYISSKRDPDVIESVEEFRKVLDHYGCTAKTETAKMIFFYAYDAVTYMLDELIMMGYTFGG